MEKVHYERMNWESEVAQESCLIKTHLTIGKGTQFLTRPKEKNPSFFGELEPIPKSTRVSSFREYFSLRAWNGWGGGETEGWEDVGIEAVVFVSVPTVPTLDDRPVFRLLDLISEYILSLLNTSRIVPNQSKDWRNRGYKLTNASPKPLSPRQNPQPADNGH